MLSAKNLAGQPDVITARFARSILEELANLPDPATIGPEQLPVLQQRIHTLTRRFPHLFDDLRPLMGLKARVGPLRQNPDTYLFCAVIGLSRHVRRIWKLASHPREAEWMLFELRRLYRELADEIGTLQIRQTLSDYQESQLEAVKDERFRKLADIVGTRFSKMLQERHFWGWVPSDPPRLTPFDQVMFRFQRMLSQARECANHDCRHPYFFAYGRRKFCSEPCARAGQREYKLKWWNDKGKKRRQRRQSRRRSKR
jgi:hypothetical protein